jgi:hypothetical protein
MRPDAASAIRAQLIAAMAQRAASLEGEARRALDARLAELQTSDADAPEETPASGAARTHPGPLRELVERRDREASTERAAYPDVPALAGFRQLWSTLRTDSQLQRSVAHAPTDAGPLNSTALASRAIALMRELSPDYLRSFLAYVDDLAWLEQLGSGGTIIPAVAKKKRVRRKP